jgi:hypothetical protein
MRQLFITAVGAITYLVLIATTTNADPEACRDTMNDYNNARNGIADTSRNTLVVLPIATVTMIVQVSL